MDDRLDPNQTPSGLDSISRPPKRGRGVKQVNRVPIIIGGAVSSVILVTVLYTAHQKSVHKAATAEPELQEVASSEAPNQLLRHPAPGQIILPDGKPKQPTGKPQGAVPTPPAIVQSAPPNPYAQEWQQYHQDMTLLHQQRVQQLASALTDDTGIKTSESFSSGNVTGGKNAVSSSRPVDTDYLASYRTGARNALEVKEGTAIPATLIGGINSDKAGMLKAQVRQNVYDSATGQKVLIPQGSWIIGEFNSQVGYGQSRIEVAFTRIIFPDQSSLDLGGMEGADVSGNAGFADQVNSHWWKIMGNALMAAAFGSALQLSQNSNSFSGNSSSGYGGYNAQQIIAAQLGQQTGELGMEIARRGLQIPPTITIRPGYEFNVMVKKDMILPEYQDQFGNGSLHTTDDE
ncbi:TrbI/VirB10 family protein [Asaia spathodeae]|uniref:Conjugal transfer protein TrbI n=1 Tax=Asaia spathodeae TaxID=657016 RepID=A0ABX2P8C6_9PROT|nr:TrbI/VirB10 family protein [Asaia spathodeae]GBR16781.1 conjugal transfer protein TrbI [Asaia spathodeae NBRC 105894]